MTDRPSRRHVPALDGVRGLAIALVIVHNVGAGEAQDRPRALDLFEALTHPGWVGVQLFFVLSGFLITGGLLDTRGDASYFRGFWVRRTLRIFPLYYAALVLRFVVVPLAFPGLRVGWEQAYFWLYVSNWSALFGESAPGLAHFWSLAVEEQFYLAWPLVVRWLSPRALGAACVGLAALSFASRLVMWKVGLPTAWLYESTIARLDALTLGALGAVVLRDPGLLAWARRAMAAVLGLAAAGLALVMAITHGLSRMSPLVQTLGYGLLSVLFAAAVLAIVDAPEGRASRLLSWRPLRTLGTYSYGMYVVHLPLHLVLGPMASGWLEHGSAARRIAALSTYIASVSLASLGLAALSYRFFEMPFLRLKDRFAPRG